MATKRPRKTAPKKPEAEVVAHPRANLDLMATDVWLRTIVEPAVAKIGAVSCFVAWEDEHGVFHCAPQNCGNDTLLLISSMVRRIAEGDLEL